MTEQLEKAFVKKPALAALATSVCHMVCETATTFLALATTLSTAARQVKPLRALLDLSETDAWAFDGIMAKAFRYK